MYKIEICIEHNFFSKVYTLIRLKNRKYKVNGMNKEIVIGGTKYKKSSQLLWYGKN